MKFTEIGLDGAFLIEPEPITDSRGFLVRTWSRSEFATRGLNSDLEECSVVVNDTKGILRGMHFQEEPFGEAKLVRCTNGAVYDVVIDLRSTSGTFLRWEAFELTSSNRLMLYVPEGFAHGYMTLSDSAELFYQMSRAYVPSAARGVRWDDRAFGISWPANPSLLSLRDANFPDFLT